MIGIDDLPSSAYATPPPTFVHLPVKRIGQQTASALIGVLEQGEPIEPIEIKSRILIRNSPATPR